MSDVADLPSPDLRTERAGGLLATYGVWVVTAVALAVLPHVFSSGLALTTMCLMGVMIIFALSYNMLLGQTGLLSFGQAVFFGLGGFLTVHMMNLVESNNAPLPLMVFPLVGAATGLAAGLVALYAH